MSPIFNVIIGTVIVSIGLYAWYIWLELIQESPKEDALRKKPTTINEWYKERLIEPPIPPVKPKITGCEYCKQVRLERKREARREDGKRRGQSLSRKYNSSM